MSALTGINRERITFSNHESQVAPDNEIRFIDAFVEEFISTVRGAKGRDLTVWVLPKWRIISTKVQ